MEKVGAAVNRDEPVIYSTTGEQPDDPENELVVTTLADGTVLVSTSELDGQVAEVAAAAWRRRAEQEHAPEEPEHRP